MLIIFDCDGVLRSVSWEAIYRAYLAIAEYLDRNPQEFWQGIEDFKKWHDTDWQLNLEMMGVSKGSDYSAINKLFHEVYDPYVRTFPWVGKVMEDLASRHTLAVLSAATSSSVRGSLLDHAEHIQLVIGCDHVRNVKPDPEGIHLIMRKTQSRIGETLMIGDTYADILAGKNAGVKTAGVVWGMESRHDLEKLKPDHMFLDPEMFSLL